MDVPPLAASADDAAPRIATLDLVRGVAVLGILLMNIVAFAMPEAAYMNPRADGDRGPLDILIWAINAVLVDGRMRGLFSVLFGASVLLVADRAEARGASAAAVHYRRMAWLFLFGMAHLLFVWWGDILQHYALVGCIAFAFRREPPHRLAIAAAMLVLVETILLAGLPGAIHDTALAMATGHPTAATVDLWQSYRESFGVPGSRDRLADVATYRGSYATIFRHRLPDALATPWRTLVALGPETLAYMLIGMALLKSGMLAGTWPRAAYRRWALIGFGLGVPCYAALAWHAWASGFTASAIALTGLTLASPIRPVMIVGWAAAIILLARPGGALTERLAAAGRMAFSNYLLCSAICTTIFYGYGLGWYGALSRARLYPVVAILWLAMLGWSRPWLAHYRYGPLEWLWRSLSRGQAQPMRR